MAVIKGERREASGLRAEFEKYFLAHWVVNWGRRYHKTARDSGSRRKHELLAWPSLEFRPNCEALRENRRAGRVARWKPLSISSIRRGACRADLRLSLLRRRRTFVRLATRILRLAQSWLVSAARVAAPKWIWNSAIAFGVVAKSWSFKRRGLSAPMRARWGKLFCRPSARNTNLLRWR